MEVLFAFVAALLIAVGIFMLLSRVIVRVVIGLAFIAYGANLAILIAGGLKQLSPPLLSEAAPYVDPLPQALILTAIVIGFATTALLLTVAIRAYQVAGHDDVAAFGDNLADDPHNPDGSHADAEHPGPDLPDTEVYEHAPVHAVWDNAISSVSEENIIQHVDDPLPSDLPQNEYHGPLNNKKESES